MIEAEGASGSSSPGASSRTIILCLGNDVRSDDGVGWEVAARLESDLRGGAVVRRSGQSGFYLLDELTGYEHAVVVDAIKTGIHPPGTVLSFPLDSIGTSAGPSPHSMGLPAIVRLGRQSGVPLPEAIDIVAVEIEDSDTIGVGLTPAVRAAVPVAAMAAEQLACGHPGPHG